VDAERLLARRRVASFSRVGVSGKADPTGRRLIRRFSLRGAALVPTIDKAALSGLPRAVVAMLLEAIGLEAQRIISEAGLECGSYSLGGATPSFNLTSGVARAQKFVASYGAEQAGDARSKAEEKKEKKQASRPPRRARASPLQPDHRKEKTEALLVYGWKTRVDFDDIGGRLADLAAAVDAEPSRPVFVVATDFPNGGACIADVVIGWAAARAAAAQGPVMVELKELRAIEKKWKNKKTLSSETRTALKPLLMSPITGPPTWRLVPTGALACGDVAFGERIATPPYDDRRTATDLVVGCDMTQTSHKNAVRGERVAACYRWAIRDVDLSEPAHRARLKRRPAGRSWLIAAYA